MNKNCYTEGMLQAFLDGELNSDLSVKIAAHISVCNDCALLLAAAEEETAFAFSALEGELNALVPTTRLWAKINDSIEDREKSVWQNIFAYFVRPQFAAFAALLIVLGVFVGLSVNKFKDKKIQTAQITRQEKIAPIASGETINAAESEPARFDENEKNTPETIKLPDSGRKIEPNYRAVKTNFVKRESEERKEKTRTIENKQPLKVRDLSAETAELLPGEDGYIKTIGTLQKTIAAQKDAALDVSARFEFERNLAVTDDAIEKMQAEVRKNPKNNAAKDVLRVSYQNKIDLLNSVAEKSELMASLKN